MYNNNEILDTPVKLLIASVVLAIPAMMIALSVLLPSKLNRILNIVFGVLFTIIVLLVGVGSITAWYSFYVLYAFIEAVISSVIVYMAWKWSKQDK